MGLHLGDLNLSLASSEVEAPVAQLCYELRRRGLPDKIKFWVADEWFCPDGVMGIALPFYLLHPRLKELEEKQIGAIDGDGYEDIMKILRHEAGHALDNGFHLRKKKRRQQLFGPSILKYPKSYKASKFSRRFVRNLVGGYGQSHPDEDFAETFAVWLDPRSAWRRRYNGWPALDKLHYMDVLMKSLKGKAPFSSVLSRGPYQPLHSQNLTLGDYFVEKKRRFRKNAARHLDHQLLGLTCRRRGEPLAQMLISSKKKLQSNLSLGLGLPRYRAGEIIRDMSQRSRELGVKLPDNARKRSRGDHLLDLVTAFGLEWTNQGCDRVIL